MAGVQVYRVPYLGMVGDYQQLNPVVLDFGRVDADPSSQVDVTLDYTASYVSLAVTNRWKLKTFDLANTYPAYTLTFRHVARLYLCRIFWQPSGTYGSPPLLPRTAGSSLHGIRGCHSPAGSAFTAAWFAAGS